MHLAFGQVGEHEMRVMNEAVAEGNFAIDAE